MDRIKLRIVVLVAMGAVSSIFVASPARAAESCHPMPDVVCNTQDYIYNCVYMPIRYGYTPPECRA